jgi:phosphoribosylformylglycinamidine synthase
VARIIVDVHLKPEILDPQGRAVQGALGRLGLGAVSSVRQGKQFVIDIDGELDAETEEHLHALADSLLCNPVIEDYTVRTVAEESA